MLQTTCIFGRLIRFVSKNVFRIIKHPCFFDPKRRHELEKKGPCGERFFELGPPKISKGTIPIQIVCPEEAHREF